MTLNNLETKTYKLVVLTEEQKQALREQYGVNVAASDGIIPVVYGILNKQTGVIEHYTANLPQSCSVMSMLEEGLTEELKRIQDKPKAELRSV